MAKAKKDWHGEARSASPANSARALRSAFANKTRAMSHIRATARGLRATGSLLAFPKTARAKAASAAPLPIVGRKSATMFALLAKVSIALALGAGVICEAFGLP